MTLGDIVKKLPPEMQGTIQSILNNLPPSERDSLVTLFRHIPTQSGSIRSLLALSINQIKQTFGDKHRVAIVGPANVGKSTLYNQFVQHREDRAEVSPVPGTTRVNQQADAGLFAVVDTPGADAVGEVGEDERKRAFEAARSADFLIIMFDAIQGIKRAEQDLFNELVSLGKPYIVTLNKIDLVNKDKDLLVQHTASSLGLLPEQIIPIAAREGKNLAEVLLAIAVAEPQMVAAMGRALPAYRWQLAWRTIGSAASVSAAIALTPLPVIDFVPLIATQAIMVMGIARIYDYRITIERARELVATFGLGLLGRTLFQELSKFGGFPGWLLSSAVAASTTVAMGYAAAAWFDRGEKISRDTLDRITRETTQQLLETLKGIGKRRPGKESLRDRIQTALEKPPHTDGENPAEKQRRP